LDCLNLPKTKQKNQRESCSKSFRFIAGTDFSSDLIPKFNGAIGSETSSLRERDQTFFAVTALISLGLKGRIGFMFGGYSFDFAPGLELVERLAA
jgi:hypothetical protein